MGDAQTLAVMIYIGALLAWCFVLTIFVIRATDRVRRLDAVLADLLTVLGFPKKDAPPPHSPKT